MPRHLISDAHEWINEIPTVPTDRHPATSQKLLMSTQSTLPAAPALAPLLLSASIVPIPLSLNLLSKTPLHSTQTGDSNLVANTMVEPRGGGAAAAGPGHRQASFSFAPACQWQWPTSALAGNDAEDSQTHACLSVARRFR